MADERIEEIRKLLPRGMLADWVRLGSRLVRLLRDRLHPSRHNAILDRLLDQARASVALREQRQTNLPRLNYPLELPITARKDDIVAAIRAHQVVIIAGETGSGKTTQIPKMCLEAGLGIEAQIGCTQPRRVAALSISRRIAEELNVSLGREVGCKIRFDDQSSPQTFIKLMTDGILLAETRGDPLLTEYNAIIIDEAHERSLNIEFLLGYLKGLLAQRAELKLIITSATIDTQAFSRAFNDAPIIEVSGRLYPVEVIYSPLDASSEESGDMTYIEAAVAATERVLCESGQGDVLIFMPGERDIRETSDLLEGRFAREAEIIPLFGRLSSGDQQRVFASSGRRKIVIATNIAETSLTIPGIRYVVDSGLARISRYNPRTRIKRLPVEPVSQSSANQRKGRSGRVQNGVCIRLYSEEDFNDRPPHTQPEIQRANLAEVILRMKAFRLGEIETFPFLNPPPPAAIQGGYELLQELGALDEARELTPLGRDLARLPVDPTIGRMLLQSQIEHATRELLIIAAGLTIQDPRERPLDQKDAAAAAHKPFLDPSSDFLALLHIWNAVHDQWETLRTQGQRRKFCKARFLSYLRMREWQDLHAQLSAALEELGTLRLNESNAAYEAIHRSILTGLLGHVAKRTERNVYEGAGKRQFSVFPGSALHERFDPPKRGGSAQTQTPTRPPSTKQPEWVMSAEIVETSQTFIRTLAGFDPEWIVQLAPHLCKLTHTNPHWSATAGRVLVHEKFTLYGIEVHHRVIAHGNINPKEATEIFIRSALVEDNLLPEPPRPKREQDASRARNTHLLLATIPDERPPLPHQYRFIEQNRRIREKIETWQTRVRRHDLGSLDEALFKFYSGRLESISSVHELNGLLRDNPDPGFLCASEADLAGGQELGYDPAAFPESVPLGGQPVSLSYAYRPGEEHDGVTFILNPALADSISTAMLAWAVPGLREAQVGELLRALPKALRRELMPFPPKVAEIVRELRPAGPTLQHDLSRFIHQHYGIEVPLSAWPADALPQHLRPRIEIVGHNQKTLAAGRDLALIRQGLEKIKIEPPKEDSAWARAAQKWERYGLTAWTFGDLPERINVREVLARPSTAPDTAQRSDLTKTDLELFAWPGVQAGDEGVSLRLFRSQASAQQASASGVRRLVELALQKDVAWLQKDLRGLSRLAAHLGQSVPSGVVIQKVRGGLPRLESPDLAASEELQAAAFENLKNHVLAFQPFSPLTEGRFQAAVAEARSRLSGLAAQLIERVEVILKLRQEVLRRCGPAPVTTAIPPRTLSGLNQLGGPPAPAPGAILVRNELDALLPNNFLQRIPFDRLPQIPRYLKALLLRAERSSMNPAKDQERAALVAPYLDRLRALQSAPTNSAAAGQSIEDFRWMIEEYKVSLFAQELGTAAPVSPKRLDQQLARIRQEQ